MELNCFYCNKKGHIIKDGWLKAKEVRDRGFLAKNDNDNLKRINLSCGSKLKNGKNAFVGIDHALFCDLNPDCWYIDSGATQHMCSNEKLFSKMNLITEEKKVMIGDGTLLNCKGIGEIKLGIGLNIV